VPVVAHTIPVLRMFESISEEEDAQVPGTCLNEGLSEPLVQTAHCRKTVEFWFSDMMCTRLSMDGTI